MTTGELLMYIRKHLIEIHVFSPAQVVATLQRSQQLAQDLALLIDLA